MESKEPKLFVATKAFIRHNGRVLILRESAEYPDAGNVNKYDVPGGRVKPGERFDESLAREIFEETGLTVQVGQPFYVNEWRPVVKGEQWQIVGIFFDCESATDNVQLSKDHDDYMWIDPANFAKYPLIENLKPVFEHYVVAQAFEEGCCGECACEGEGPACGCDDEECGCAEGEKKEGGCCGGGCACGQ